ncbi:integrase arm-type DNA-binding domain-containing protein, partial [Vibrio rotiferianus]
SDKEYSLSDGGNLHLRVRPNGSKNWMFIYTHPTTKKRKKLGLGSYPDTKLIDARETATELRNQLANNIDPKLYRYKQKIENQKTYERTFYVVAEEMLKKQAVEETIMREKLIEEERKQARINNTIFEQEEIDRIRDKVRTTHRKHLFFKRNLYPQLGDLPLHYITAPAVIEVITPLQAKGQLENVKQACRLVNQVMKFGVNRGYVESNCLADIKDTFAKGIVTHMPTVPPNELGSVMAIILEFIKPISGHHKHVFPSDKPNTKFPHISKEAVNSSLNNTTLKGDLVSHGFRGIASTLLNEQKEFRVDAIEMCLAHLDKNQTRASYNSAKYLDERFDIHQFWSDYIVKSTGSYYSIAGQYQPKAKTERLT